MPDRAVGSAVAPVPLRAHRRVDAAGDAAPAATPASATAIIGHAPGITIRELGTALGLSHAGAVRLVDRLEHADMATRSRSERDGRSVELAPTRAGRRVGRRVLSARGSSLDRALDALPPSDRRTFARLSETMLRALIVDEDHALALCRLWHPAACDRCPVETELAARAAG